MTPVRLTVHRTFHSLGHSQNFRRFFIGQAVSVTGTWMQMVAAAWLVLQLTGSGVALGIDTALAFGPILLFGPLGGALADRHDKRRILLATQVTFGVLALGLWAIVATGVVELWMVYVLSFLQGVTTSIDQPTRQSFFSEMVEDRDLPNAVSLNSAVMTGTRIVGPALAGALIAGVGLSWCFFLNAVSYLAVIAALLSMHTEELRSRRAPREAGAIREGFRYAWRTDELRRPLVLMSVLYLFSFNYSVLIPLFAERTFGGTPGRSRCCSRSQGSARWRGALVMANRPPTRRTHARPRRGRRRGRDDGRRVRAEPRRRGRLDAAARRRLDRVLRTANSTLQLTSRPNMRGRVMALYGIVFLGTTPIGAPIAGWVGEHLGPRVAFAGGGLIALATGLVGLWVLSRRAASQRLQLEPSGLEPAEAA